MNINNLRETLFETLNGIKSGAIDLEKARAINEVSKTIIDTAKVETTSRSITAESRHSSRRASSSHSLLGSPESLGTF